MVNPFDLLQQEIAEVKQQNRLILERLEQVTAKQEQDQFLSIDKTCTLWQPAVSRQTIYSWEKKGFLTRHLIGNKPYFLKSEVMMAVTKIKRYKTKG